MVRTVSQADADKPIVFEPATLEVTAGTTVRWRNDDGAFHTITFRNGGFSESLFVRGNSVEYTFEQPGTYEYYCQPHSDFMSGIIVVK